MNVYGRIIKTLFFILILSASAIGQNFDPIFIPFEVDGEDLQNPLIGGLSAPQFCSFDLDGEGAEDLIVFERNGNVLLPFINLSTPGNPSYLYAPEYTPNFPKLDKFVKFIDFNNDGKKDIFALSNQASAIEVWRNTSQGGSISFEFMKFNFGIGDFIQIPAGGSFTNLFVSTIDIPAIIDTDGDGDLDILTFDPGGSFMNHFQNMVKEMDLPDDTLVYQTSDLCWGNFVENGLDETIVLSDDRDDCAQSIKGGAGVSTERHAGSTVTVFDSDGDGDLDMLLGDVANHGLVYLENDEVDGDAFIIDQDTNFPSNSEEADIFVFLGAFFLDVDNDGKRDLIVCPNNERESDNLNHIWFYRNVGEDNAPIFELEQKDFLHETTLRMGHSSHPCFLDYNEDGLLDILVGMNYIFSNGNTVSISLYLYENVGSVDQPSYKLVDDDYLDLAGDLSDFNSFLAPTAGDLDGDGDTDILIAENRSFLFYFENKAGPGQPYAFENYIYEYKGLRVGSNGKPFIIDLDGDGLSDIIMGERGNNGNSEGEQGGVNFFKNVGEIGNPDFVQDEETFPNTNILGRIFTKTNSDTSGESVPYFFKSDGRLMVAVGSRGGNVYLYDDIEENVYGEFNLVSDQLPILNAGRRTAPAVADIDNDGFHEMIVGNDNGGLMAFNTTFESDKTSSTDNEELSQFDFFPNPTSDILKANVISNATDQFTITGMDGKLVLKGAMRELNSGIDVSYLPSGIYVLSVENEDGFQVQKFVKY